MKDRGGRIKIPGLLRRRAGAEARRSASSGSGCRSTSGATQRSSARRSCSARRGYTTLERVWARPTFEVNGLLGGFTGEGAKTVIPAVAMAKVSMRLVPNQDPDKIAQLFEDYVKKVAPKTVEVKVTRMHGGKPWMTDFDNQFVQAAGRAIEKGFGKAPVFNREGGSIPVVATFQEILGLPSVLFGDRPARRERARTEREARPRQLPRRHHRVGLPVRRDCTHSRLQRRPRLRSHRSCGADRDGRCRSRGCSDPRARPAQCRRPSRPTTRPPASSRELTYDRERQRPDRHVDRHGRRAADRDRGSIATRTAGSIAGSTTTASGRLLKVGFSRQDDGKPDAWAFPGADGKVARVEVSSTGDEKKIDRWEYYTLGGGADACVGPR